MHEFESHQFTDTGETLIAEASDLRLRPGQFPDQFRLLEPDGTGRRYRLADTKADNRTGEIIKVIYHPRHDRGTTRTITILND